jgi:hypothetical protein
MLDKKAAYYRLGLQLGTHTVADVIAWADSEIAKLAEPPVDLIDLALMTSASRYDVFDQLGALSGTVKPLDVVETVLKDAHTLLKADPNFGPSLARGLYEFYVECGYEVPNRLLPIASFDDAYALARNGIDTVEEVYQRLLAFTAEFQDAP